MGFSEIEQGVFLRKGRDGGDRRALVVGIHGDERDGLELLEEVLAEPENWQAPSLGDFLLIAGNPPALAVGERTGPGGIDLNRMFGESISEEAVGSPEASRAALLKELLSGVDCLLDLHQTTVPGPSMAVSAETDDHLRLSADLGLKVGVLGMERIFGPVMLAQWFDTTGGLGLTVETGQKGTTESKGVCRQVFEHFLRGCPATGGRSLPLLRVFQRVPTPGSKFCFTRPLHNGSLVTKGELIGVSVAGPMHAPETGTVLLPAEGKPVGAPCMMLATSGLWSRA